MDKEVSTWVEDSSMTNRSIACADLDLAAMETDQVEKRSKRYAAPLLMPPIEEEQ